MFVFFESHLYIYVRYIVDYMHRNNDYNNYYYYY